MGGHKIHMSCATSMLYGIEMNGNFIYVKVELFQNVGNTFCMELNHHIFQDIGSKEYSVCFSLENLTHFVWISYFKLPSNFKLSNYQENQTKHLDITASKVYG